MLFTSTVLLLHMHKMCSIEIASSKSECTIPFSKKVGTTLTLQIRFKAKGLHMPISCAFLIVVCIYKSWYQGMGSLNTCVYFGLSKRTTGKGFMCITHQI